MRHHSKQVHLVSNEALTIYYETAFYVLSENPSAKIIVHSADEALIRGQWKMLSHAK
jgi:hypothetical protein